jgi:hypothetical protein
MFAPSAFLDRLHRPKGADARRFSRCILAELEGNYAEHKEKKMKLRTLFILDAIVSLLVALGFLLGPATLLKFFGLSTGKTELVLAQVIGAALVGYGALAWFGKDAEDLPAIQGITASLLIFSAIGFVVTLLAVLAQVTRAGSFWVLVLLFLLSGVGYAYFQFAAPRE